MHLSRWKKNPRIVDTFFKCWRLWSGILGRISVSTPNHGFGGFCLKFRLNPYDFSFFHQLWRAVTFLIIHRFLNFLIFWKAMSLNCSFLRFVMTKDMTYPHPQGQTWREFLENRNILISCHVNHPKSVRSLCLPIPKFPTPEIILEIKLATRQVSFT